MRGDLILDESDENLAFAKMLKEQGVDRRRIKKELTLKGLDREYIQAVMQSLVGKENYNREIQQRKKFDWSKGSSFFRVLKWILIFAKLAILIGILAR